MPLETGDYIADLNPANPLGTDPVSAGDDHVRLVKKCTQQSFPNVDAAINFTPTEANALTGRTVGFTGEIRMFSGAAGSIPDNWLLCDGSAIPIDGTWADLIALIGPNTPDLRGQFLRGWSADSTVDPDGPRAALTTQADAFASHSHTQRGGGWGSTASSFIGRVGNTNDTNMQNTANTGGDETRPVNVAVVYIISR